MINQRTKRLVFTICKWLFSAAILFYVLHEIDIKTMSKMLYEQNILIVFGVFSLLIIQLFISTWRWQIIIASLIDRSEASNQQPATSNHFLTNQQPKNFFYFLKLNLIGVFFNSCLPGTIGGDFIRSMMLRSDKYPLVVCIHSVIIDRIAALAVVFVMVISALPWLERIIPSLPANEIIALFSLFLIVGIILLVYSKNFAARKISGISRKFSELLVSAQRIVFSFPDNIIIFLQALVAHSVFCLAVAMLVASFGEILSVVDSLLLIPIVLLFTALPISLGGWGVRELGMVGLLTLVGISKNAALAASVQLGIIQIIISLPGAFLYILSKKQS